MKNRTYNDLPIAKNLKYLREKMGMSRPEIEDLCDVNHGELRRWENSYYCPTIRNIKKLADIYGVLASDLINKDLTIDNSLVS